VSGWFQEGDHDALLQHSQRRLADVAATPDSILRDIPLAPGERRFRTVEDGRKSFADDDAGVDVSEVIRARMQELFGELPQRYRRLAQAVWLRLPEGWDGHAHWEMTTGAVPSLGSRIWSPREDLHVAETRAH